MAGIELKCGDIDLEDPEADGSAMGHGAREESGAQALALEIRVDVELMDPPLGKNDESGGMIDGIGNPDVMCRRHLGGKKRAIFLRGVQ